jgi:hypothetical protein
MLKIINPTKISIFRPTNFDKRLNSKVMYSFMSSFYELQNKCYSETNLLKTRQLFSDLYVYHDVFIYSTIIKGRNIQMISNEELDVIKIRYNELEHIINNNTYEYGSSEYKLSFNELKVLRNTIEIQTIINNEEYLQKIKDIEEKITNIQLTDEEIMLIKNIESHPTINEIIETSGFEIIQEYH